MKNNTETYDALPEMATTWQNEQQQRATSYVPKRHEIPTAYGCAGPCTIPIPPIEHFRGIRQPLQPLVWAVVVTVVIVSVIAFQSKR